MTTSRWFLAGALALLVSAIQGPAEAGRSCCEAGAEEGSGGAPTRAAAREAAFRARFDLDPERLSPTGRNDYFILEPGHRIVLRTEDGAEEVVITVLEETRRIQGVLTRVVEERETKDGRLIEVSKNFFAIDRETKDVYYFGEDVTKFRADGAPYAASDAWIAGRARARAGLMMPGRPRVGDRFYQEQAPRVAMDRSEIVSLDESVETPSGVIEGAMKVLETTPLEPRERSYKYYARGIGMIGDGDIRLVEHGSVR